MRHFLKLTALALGLFVASPADARGSFGQWGTDLVFVADTTIPSAGANNQPIALCRMVDYMQIFFVPVYTISKGYALSNDACADGMYRDLSTKHLADLQAAGMIDASVPATPTLDLKQLIWGHAWLIIAAIALLFKLATRLRSRSHSGKGSKPADTLAIHSLVAMSQVAVADGNIDQRELQQISAILTRLTGRGYSIEQVSDLLTRLNPSPNDLDEIGQDLSESDRQIVLEAALNIAVADGEIHPNEYAVVSDLAQRMRIGADQFRGALNRIAIHMNAAQTS